MEKPKHHIFICTSSRVAGEPKGAVAAEASQDIGIFRAGAQLIAASHLLQEKTAPPLGVVAFQGPQSGDYLRRIDFEDLRHPLHLEGAIGGED